MRRLTAMKPSRGTEIPTDVRIAVRARDRYCVCDRAGFPIEVQERCRTNYIEPEIDHVRASGGMGLKSASTPSNLVLLSGWCHRWKTENGRTARPLLLAYLETAEDPHAGHIDPCSSVCHRVRLDGSIPEIPATHTKKSSERHEPRRNRDQPGGE